MAQGHKVGNSPAATKVKVDKPSIEQNGKSKSKLTKRQIGIICGIAVVLVVALVAALILILNHDQPQPDTQDDAETTQTEPEVDYDQKITSEDGSVFKAEYQQGSESNFTARFTNLKCEDGCKNVSEVKVGDKVLKQGEDYEVKSGSIIIILKGDFLDKLQAGKFDLVITIRNGDNIDLYGVKFTIKPVPTCGEDGVLEKGECVKKTEEQPNQNQTSNNTSKPSSSQTTKPSQPTQPSQPSQPAAPSKSQAQIECENRQGPIGYTIILRPQSGRDTYFNAPSHYIPSSGTNMVWADGGCHPHVKDFGIAGAFSEYTPEDFQQVAPDYYNAMIPHPSKDLVVWRWGNSQTTYEFYDNGNVVNNY